MSELERRLLDSLSRLSQQYGQEWKRQRGQVENLSRQLGTLQTELDELRQSVSALSQQVTGLSGTVRNLTDAYQRLGQSLNE